LAVVGCEGRMSMVGIAKSRAMIPDIRKIHW
jgi:hypothetical protein